MANDKLRILIEGLLNKEKTEENINKQIERIERRIKKLKLNIVIDENIVKNLKEAIDVTSKFQNVIGDQDRVIKEFITEIYHANGVIERIIQQQKASGEIFTRTTKEINNQTQAIKENVKALGQLARERIKTNKSGEIIGHRKTYINDNVTTTVNQLTGDVERNIDYYKRIKFEKDYEQWWLKSLKERELRQEAELKKQHEKRLKYEKDYENWWLKALKERELQEEKALRRNQERRLKYEKDYENWWLKALKERELQEQKLAEKRGKLIGQYDVLIGKNVTEQQLKEVLALNEAYKDREIREISLNTSTGRWTATLRENAKENRILKGVIDQTTGSLYLQENALRSASAKQLGFFEQLEIAMARVPIWMAATTAFFGTWHFFTEGISFVNELNKALTQISIVTGKNQEQVAELGREYNQLAKEMGVLTGDIAEASVEFYRQGLTQEEVMKRVRVATQYAKISNLEFKDAAEILTATVNSMGVDIERAADVFAYLGDATATGICMCRLAA